MVRTILILVSICSFITLYWMHETNYGPFIYRHAVPEKLRTTVQILYENDFKELDIRSIKFGKYNAQRGELVSIVVDGNRAAEFQLPDSLVGVVLIEYKNQRLELYWEITDGLNYEQALSILSSQLSVILEEYRRRLYIERTFE